MTITLDEASKTGVKFLDSAGKDITATGLDKDQEFYIEVSKKANIGNVKFKLMLNNVVTFSPKTDRGRVYYQANTQGSVQNAMSGGKITTGTIEGTFDVVTNAKTGVENIAMLLMVTLVAFTLGYLVLSYKSKPIQLQ